MDRSLFLARITRITLSVIVALSIASAASAQEALKGEVVTVDKASKKIGIKLSGTVGQATQLLQRPLRFKMRGCLTW
ncbi:MAG: hypothetical protein WCF62_25035, partial [Pseudolabrys sp.]|jgi:hypothetical protein